MSNVILYNPSDSTVPGRVTGHLFSVNTPDYMSNPNALINPDLSLVSGVEQRFWKVSDSTVVPMGTSDKSSMLPRIKIDHKNYLQDQAHGIIDMQYRSTEQSVINGIFSDSGKDRINRHLFYQDWVNWLDTVETELYNKTGLVNDKTSIEDVEAIAINSSALLAADPQIKVENGIGISDSSSLTNFLDAYASVTDASTGITGPYYLMELLNHRKELYNDSTNPLYNSSHTPILGTSGILMDHANRVLNLETIHGKEGWHEQQVLQAMYVQPKDVLVYYGYPNSFNSAVNGWDNEKVAQDMAKYSLIALGDTVENPSHPDYANTQVIIPRIKALNPDAQIFGYVALAQSLANFQTKVDQWNTLAVHGIFIDEAGYDYGKTRSEFNACVDYVHGKTTSKLCFANAWNTDHILGTTNDASYPNSTYNSGLVASHLTNTDWIMLESFPINTTAYSGAGGYESKSDWLVRGQKAVNLRATYGVNFAGQGVINNNNANGADLFNFGFVSAMMFALEAFGTSDTNYASSSAAVTYWTRPSTSGIGLVYEQYPSVTVSSLDADVYLRYVNSAIFMLDFSTSAQLNSITKLNVDNNIGKNFVGCQTVLMSNLAPGSAGFLLISGTAYFVYLGMITNPFVAKYVEFHVSTIGAGAQTSEVGLFSSSVAPNKASKSLTKIVSTGTVDSLTSTGIKRNTSAFTNTIPGGTHLWAGIRTAMATTQPTIWGIGIDMAQGQVLSTAASGVLTGAGPWTGAIIAASTSVICPDLRVTLS